MNDERFDEVNTGIASRARELVAGHTSDGPIQMLNLLRFVPGGEATYMEYIAAAAPLAEQFGIEVVSAARPAEALIGEHRWDLVLVVRYPNRKTFVDTANTRLFAEIEHLRERAVAESELHVMDPVTGMDPRD